jgi:hypothetical protein
MTTRGARALSASIAVGVLLVAVAALRPTAASSEAPDQPIDFSHRDHIEQDRLACELCHSGVRRSAFAGMPPMERCMGCHRFVLPSNPEIMKLRRDYDAGKSVRWVKVYALPRFVQFSHAAHTSANVSCATCHGDVAAMDRVARVTPLTMGWCVQCHRETRAPDDCLICHY